MKGNYLLNAIIGDAVGSIYEWNRIKVKPERLVSTQCRITDDTSMTIAIAEALMTDKDYADHMRTWGNLYPNLGYGGMFRKWLSDPTMGPYNSFGNGSAMRVSSCGYLDNPIDEARRSAEVTHNHIEGIKGAEIVSECISLSRKVMRESGDVNDAKSMIRSKLLKYYPEYDQSLLLKDRRPRYKFYSTCQNSVPQSIQCVLEAVDYADTLRLAISMGGDSDTMACIAGSIAGVIWKKPEYLVDWIRRIMPKDMLKVVDDFDDFVDGTDRG